MPLSKAKAAAGRRAVRNNALTGGASVPWTPASLATAPRGWYQADTLPFAGGANPTSWPDSSSSSNNATAFNATGTAITVVASGLNGLKVVDFDGSNSAGFDLPTGIFGSAPAGCYFMVMRQPPSVSPSPLPSLGSFVDFSYVNYGGATFYDTFGSASDRKQFSTPGGLDTTVYHLYSATAAANDWHSWIDGVDVYNTTTNTVGWNTTNPRISGSGFIGRVAEIILLPYVPSPTERQNIEGYLAAKWGLQSLLPGAHPYKSVGPATAGGVPTLAFTAQPSDGAEGTSTSATVDVPGGTGDVVAAVVDGLGATVTNLRSAVAGGAASFVVTRPPAGSGYRLIASRQGARPAASSSFNTIVAGSGSQAYAAEDYFAEDYAGTPSGQTYAAEDYFAGDYVA